MFVLGIVLIVVAVLAGLGVATTSGQATTLEVYGIDLGMSVSAVFFFGAAAGAVAIAGLWLVKKGVGRGYRRRKEVKELRQQVEATPTTPDKQVETAPAAPGTGTSDEVAEGTDTVAKGTNAADEGTDHPRSSEHPVT
ncbi:hypothetical protein OG394_23095 [Kribbella sp. NBC_01245]|uniref:hypothetical protein n=1 Tax=Kribbella sp. NBC_01245 TaxID=2903578 RepID=UPI002E2B0437|nr:hypothetical protein [Kribbella sp. NBC_01245]